MFRYNHHSAAIRQDDEYLDAVVTTRMETPKDPIETAVVKVGAVHVEEAPVDAERSKMADFEGHRRLNGPFVGKQELEREQEEFPRKNQLSPRAWSRDWFVYTMGTMTITFLALVGYGFASGLFLPPNASGGNTGTSEEAASGPGGVSLSAASSDSLPAWDTAFIDRQDYKSSIVTLLELPIVMERTSPQARALEWLAFEDEPLFDPSYGADEQDQGHHQKEKEFLTQRYALVVWYFAQGGPTVWKTLNREPSSGWIEFGAGVHECDWRGVDCDYYNDIGTVVGLRLSPALGLVLTGSSLSTELGLLTGLRRIDFSDQRLRGKIPDEWSALTNLEMVVLSKNQLQATIPQWIGGWTKLEHLALNGNLLFGTIPSSMGTLQDLKHLELETNPQLRGRFDDVLFNVVQSPVNDTRMATLSGPKFSLEFLDLSNTDLEGELPPTTLPNLRSLRLWNTRGLGGTLPPEIGTWSNLETFSLKESPRLEGRIPTEFGLLKKLKTLEIQDSIRMWGELPTELANLSSNLEVINFRYTNQTGSLPLEWASLSNLERIDLMQNGRLEGTVPPEYSQLTSLRFLDLRGTDLTGEVPDSVCALQSLEEFLADCSNKNDKTTGTIVCVCCVWCHTS